MTSKNRRSLFVPIGLGLLVSVAIIIAAGAFGITAPGIISAGTAFWLIGATLVTMLVAAPLTLWALDRHVDQNAHSEQRIRHEMADQLLAARVEARDDLADVAAQSDGRFESIEQDVARLQGRVHAVEEAANNAPTEGAAIAAAERDVAMQAVRSSFAEQLKDLAKQQRASWGEHEARHEEEAQQVAGLRAELDEALGGVIAHVDLRWSDHAAEHEDLATAMAHAQEENSKRIQQHRAAVDERLESHEQSIGQAFTAERANTSAEVGALQDNLSAQDERIHTALYEATQARETADALQGDLQEQVASNVEARLSQLEGQLQQMEQGGTETILQAQQAQLESFKQEIRAMIEAAGVGRAVAVREENGIRLTAHAPFGKVYPVHDVEGIGNKTSYALQKQGILDTEHLWHADTNQLAEDLQITARQVRQWQTQAELMAINGIGRQWSELLAISGVTSISHLGNLRPRELLDMLEHGGHIRDHHVQKGRISLSMVEEWIRKAQEHAPTKSVYV